MEQSPQTTKEQPRNDRDAVEEMFNQAANEGTLDTQRDTLNQYATEVGTTVDALQTARNARNEEALRRAHDDREDLPPTQSAEDDF